jgi:hypothetical protein
MWRVVRMWGPLAAITLAGYVLPVWWLVTPHPRGVAGLVAYPSAYIGDTLLLPVGCLILIIGIRTLPRAPRERLAGLLGAAAGAVAAVTAQADWLDDPTTRPDWTLPRAGHFSAAGWWHAAYFTAMGVTLVTLTVIFLARVRAARAACDPRVAGISSGTGAALLLTVLGGYAVLAVHDDFSGPLRRSAAGAVALAGLAVVLAAVLAVIAYGRLARVLVWPAALAAAGITVIASLGTLPPLPGSLCCAVVVAAGAAAAAPHCRKLTHGPGGWGAHP